MMTNQPDLAPHRSRISLEMDGPTLKLTIAIRHTSVGTTAATFQTIKTALLTNGAFLLSSGDWSLLCDVAPYLTPDDD